MYIYAQLHWVPKIMTLTFDLDPIYNLGYDTLIKYLLSHVFKLFSLPSWPLKKKTKKSD